MKQTTIESQNILKLLSGYMIANLFKNLQMTFHIATIKDTILIIIKQIKFSSSFYYPLLKFLKSPLLSPKFLNISKFINLIFNLSAFVFN